MAVVSSSACSALSAWLAAWWACDQPDHGISGRPESILAGHVLSFLIVW